MPSSIIKPRGRRRGHLAKPVAHPRRPPAPPVIDIVSRGVELTPGQRSHIEEASAALRGYYRRILGIEAVVTVPHRRLHREAISYEIRLRIDVPTGELVVRRQRDPDFRTAVQEAFAAGRRMLQDHARRLREPMVASEGLFEGRVTRLLPFERYGFLEGPEGEEVYFHAHSVVGGAFDRLEIGQPVRFAVEAGDRGPQASTVTADGRARRRASRRAVRIG